jgi:hypothetical protein
MKPCRKRAVVSCVHDVHDATVAEHVDRKAGSGKECREMKPCSSGVCVQSGNLWGAAGWAPRGRDRGRGKGCRAVTSHHTAASRLCYSWKIRSVCKDTEVPDVAPQRTCPLQRCGHKQTRARQLTRGAHDYNTQKQPRRCTTATSAGECTTSVPVRETCADQPACAVRVAPRTTPSWQQAACNGGCLSTLC